MALKPNGKTEKAKKKIAAVNNEIIDIVNKLQDIEKSLLEIPQTNMTGSPKQKSMIAILPKRIEFDLNHLHFYIDFTLMAPENDTSVGMKGCMIYGVNRSTCFAECIFPKGGRAKCKSCERVSRCDRLEDKPLIQFFIDRHGMIQSAGEFEDSWWIEKKDDLPDEKKDDLPELHFRTMELIWPRALAWTNENILA